MDGNQRIKHLINVLKEKKMIRNQQDFVERIGSDKSTISQVTNGKQSIPNNLFDKIKKAFPIVSMEWLNTGTGDIFIPSITQHNKNGDNINGQTVTINAETEKLLEVINSCHEMLKKKDEQINKLLTIIENYK